MPSGASAQTRFLNGCSGVLGWRAPDCWRRNAARFPALQCTLHLSGPWVAVKMTASVARGSPRTPVYPAKLGRSFSVRSGRSHVCACVGGVPCPVPRASHGAAREEQKREGIPPSFLCLTRTPGQNAPRAGERTAAGLPRAAGCSLRSCGRDAQRRSIQFVDNPLHYRLSLPQEVRCAASP
jgi:hypothetical protein